MVVQCMRQYTDNTPGGRTAEYPHVGGRGNSLHSPGRPFVPDET